MVSLSITISRSRAEMIPVVTVPPRDPSGLPMAIAADPTFRSLELPKVAGWRFCASTLMTARSVEGSVPTSFASYSVPSAVRTAMDRAPSTTWLLVMM